MRAASYLILVVAANLVLSCATTPRVNQLEACLTDPQNNALHCNGVTKPFDFGYECYKLGTLDDYLKGCR